MSMASRWMVVCFSGSIRLSLLLSTFVAISGFSGAGDHRHRLKDPSINNLDRLPSQSWLQAPPIFKWNKYSSFSTLDIKQSPFQSRVAILLPSGSMLKLSMLASNEMLIIISVTLTKRFTFMMVLPKRFSRNLHVSAIEKMVRCQATNRQQRCGIASDVARNISSSNST